MKNKEHDMTKLMLETIRAKTSKHKAIIKEDEEEAEAFTSDTGGLDLEDFEKEFFTSNSEAFTGDKGVTQDTKFTSFEVNKQTDNVVFGGILGNGIEWSYSLKKGVKIGTPIGNRYVDITKEDIITLNKLVQYYDIWKNQWLNLFRTDSTLRA